MELKGQLELGLFLSNPDGGYPPIARPLPPPPELPVRAVIPEWTPADPWREGKMPKYKDGTPAQVGDYVKGHLFNTQKEIAGVVVEIRPGEFSDCTVAFAFDAGKPSQNLFGRSEVVQLIAGRAVMLRSDYGALKNLRLVCGRERASAA